MEDAKRGLKQAQKDLNKCRKEATELRKEFQDKKIEAAAIAEDTTSEKLLKKLRHCEAQSACFRKLACALKTNGATKGGVKRVCRRASKETDFLLKQFADSEKSSLENFLLQKFS
jgi:DNA gyrase/topoisomerase IV subunit A